MIEIALPMIAAATPLQDSSRDLTEALDAALDACAAPAFGRSATLNGRLAIFSFAGAPFPNSVQNTEDLPPLIKRFLATARYSRIFGHRDVVAIEASDGIVWLVLTAQPSACDIAVTGVKDAGAISSAVAAAVTSNEGWNVVTSNQNDVMWMASFALEGSSDGTMTGKISAMAIAPEMADSNGIQAEINFIAEDSNIVRNSEN